MIFDDKPSVSAAQSVIYEKELSATIKYILKVRRGIIVTFTQKLRYSMANSTVPVTVVLRTVSQEPVCLAQRNRQRSKALRDLIIAYSLVFLISYQVLCRHYFTP